MQVRVLTEKDRTSWDDFVASRHGSQILQSYEWGEFKAKLGWDHFIVAVEDGGTIKAGLSILSRKLPVVKKNFFYAPRGPVVPFSDPGLVNALIDGVCVEAALRNAIALKIDPEIDEKDAGAVNILKNRGFIRKHKQVQPRTTYFIDLTKGLDDLLMSFEEKTRYNIRLAERKGVTVREESTGKGIEVFYKIYRETSKRDVFLIHPQSYYLKLKECLIDRGMANVFIAEYQNVPVAALFAFRFGDRIWYMYGASINDYRNVMPNHALHWHLIKWAKEKGLKVYDLWGIPSSPAENHPLFGVYRFKKGFNGAIKSWIGAYDLPFEAVSYTIFDKGMSFYQGLRSLLTKGRISDSLSE
jgi:lipid II:glycine glycyltransferase (peptidoglycan interpeptide bridge formation enzyme)